MKILYIGPYRDGTGWSHSAISNILALDAADIEVVPRALKLNNIQGEVPLRIKELEQRSDKGCDIVIQNSLPHHYEYDGNFKQNICYYFTETSHFKNSSWPEFINIMDEAWVPCKSNLLSSVESEVKVPIKIVPVACDVSKYQQKYDRLPIPHLENKYVFYFIGEFSRRKNLTALLKAYHLEFKPDEDVELVLKCSVPGMSPKQVEDYVSGVCNELKEQLKLYKSKSTYLSETIISQRLTEEQICSLHQMCNCYVSTSFGEGWDIPCFDAMGFGNMVLANDEGAHKDYIGDNNGRLISNTLEPVVGMKDGTFGDIYVGNEGWYNVNVNELRYFMRESFESRNLNFYKKIQRKARETVFKYSYQNVGNLMKELLGDN